MYLVLDGASGNEFSRPRAGNGQETRLLLFLQLGSQSSEYKISLQHHDKEMAINYGLKREHCKHEPEARTIFSREKSLTPVAT